MVNSVLELPFRAKFKETELDDPVHVVVGYELDGFE